jgi:hypothetical protein
VIAVFEDFHQALQYQKKYEESLIKRYLQENKNKKGRRRNPTSSKYQTMKSLGQVRCFEERTLPQLRHFKPY